MKTVAKVVSATSIEGFLVC